MRKRHKWPRAPKLSAMWVSSLLKWRGNVETNVYFTLVSMLATSANRWTVEEIKNPLNDSISGESLTEEASKEVTQLSSSQTPEIQTCFKPETVAQTGDSLMFRLHPERLKDSVGVREVLEKCSSGPFRRSEKANSKQRVCLTMFTVE